jgi:hypothetical protein
MENASNRVRRENAEFAELYFEALCFNEVAEFNDPVIAPLLTVI